MTDEFQDKEYRDAFVEANIHDGIAFQVRALRKKKKWTQGDLGLKCGKAQNVISRIEDPDYGKYTIRTLCDLASAFDVALLVKFVSFSELRSQTKDLSDEALAVPSFDEEQELGSRVMAALASPKFSNHFDRTLNSGSYALACAIESPGAIVGWSRLKDRSLPETPTKQDAGTDTAAGSAMASRYDNRHMKRGIAA